MIGPHPFSFPGFVLNAALMVGSNSNTHGWREQPLPSEVEHNQGQDARQCGQATS
jgi:hypothetical protein